MSLQGYGRHLYVSNDWKQSNIVYYLHELEHGAMTLIYKLQILYFLSEFNEYIYIIYDLQPSI